MFLFTHSATENNKDAQYQKVKVKAEPMEVDPPPAELTPPASHLLAFSTLGASEKSEPMSNLPETLARPQKDLFSQDISVKMASELLFKLSGTFCQDDAGGGREEGHDTHIHNKTCFPPSSITV